VLPDVVKRQPGFLQDLRRGRRIAIQQRQQEVDRVDLIVAEHLRLAIGVDQKLPQWKAGGGDGIRRDGDRLRVDAQRLDRVICGAAAEGHDRVEHVNRPGLQRSAIGGERSRARQHVARVSIERDVRGGSFELRGGVRHCSDLPADASPRTAPPPPRPMH
jgi:hypothetical protein